MRNPCFALDDRHPVLCDNWHDAKAFAAPVSKKANNSCRLLTVASARSQPAQARRHHRGGYLTLRGTSKLMGQQYP